jgi:hypothetical protein
VVRLYGNVHTNTDCKAPSQAKLEHRSDQHRHRVRHGSRSLLHQTPLQAADEIAGAQELVLAHRPSVEGGKAAVAAGAMWGGDLPVEPPRVQRRPETLEALTGDICRVPEGRLTADIEAAVVRHAYYRTPPKNTAGMLQLKIAANPLSTRRRTVYSPLPCARNVLRRRLITLARAGSCCRRSTDR